MMARQPFRFNDVKISLNFGNLRMKLKDAILIFINKYAIICTVYLAKIFSMDVSNYTDLNFCPLFEFTVPFELYIKLSYLLVYIFSLLL